MHTSRPACTLGMFIYVAYYDTMLLLFCMQSVIGHSGVRGVSVVARRGHAAPRAWHTARFGRSTAVTLPGRDLRWVKCFSTATSSPGEVHTYQAEVGRMTWLCVSDMALHSCTGMQSCQGCSGARPGAFRNWQYALSHMQTASAVFPPPTGGPPAGHDCELALLQPRSLHPGAGVQRIGCARQSQVCARHRVYSLGRCLRWLAVVSREHSCKVTGQRGMDGRHHMGTPGPL